MGPSIAAERHTPPLVRRFNSGALPPPWQGKSVSRRTRPYESTPAGSSARRSPEEDPKLTVSWSRAVSHDPITASTCSLVSTDRSLRRVLGRVLQQGQSYRKPPPFGTMRRPNQGEWAPVKKMYQLVDYGPGVNFNEEPVEQQTSDPHERAHGKTLVKELLPNLHQCLEVW